MRGDFDEDEIDDDDYGCPGCGASFDEDCEEWCSEDYDDDEEDDAY